MYWVRYQCFASALLSLSPKLELLVSPGGASWVGNAGLSLTRAWRWMSQKCDSSLGEEVGRWYVILSEGVAAWKCQSCRI